ncbi:hypothetical protein PR048_015545 [Dryococelus australis]|uniref:DDE-1 domain-containing protein n=1 Tax=Dryococelus australis TaxID=614101 RepID=A0ABQ9HH82_9NEOP|nr:hypothetical protein PR048_015545 [Dryococelus australis]
MKLGVFEKLFDHFSAHTKPTADDRKNFVTIICLPPHTSHKLQPLDVGVMYPLNHHYDEGLKKWLTNHSGCVINDYQVNTTSCEAYLMACSPKIAIKGFQNTGIHHYNPNIFNEKDFAPAKTTDENSQKGDPDDPMRMERFTHTPHPESHTLPPTLTVAWPLDKNYRAHTKTVGSQPEMSISSSETASIELPMQKKDVTTPKSSLPVDNSSMHEISRVSGTFSCNPEEIQPLPKITSPRAAKSAAKKGQPTMARKQREKGTTVVLTSTPYKKTLE